MKKPLILFAFLFAIILVQAQSTYKYVIIPINVPTIGKGIDPYGVSSSLQKKLNDKSIKSVFETVERPADYCDALIAYLDKENSMLKNKISIELRDCMNRVIWSNVGTGMSKEFRQGYAEAIADALKDFNALPAVQYAATPAVVAPVAPAAPLVQAATPAEVGVATASKGEYTPSNLYFGDKYLVDYVKAENGTNKLVVMNAASLGYEKFQEIATLVSSDLPGILTVKWTQPNGEVWSGVATESGSELKISISSGGSKEVISLQKQ